MTETVERSQKLQDLEKLVGTWELSGDTSGTVTYQWLDGGYFLIQKVTMSLFGRAVNVTEIIGHLRLFGESPSLDIHSRAFDANGNTFDYVYELDQDTLFIWGGQKGSPAYFKGIFSPDGNQCVGGWTYPGGGYLSTMTRIS